MVIAIRIFFFLFAAAPFVSADAQSAAGDESVAAFYRAFSGDDLTAIDQQLSRIDPNESDRSKAYTGALLMKKAGAIKGAREKLETFKLGKEYLDGVIAKNPENGEYRFLRLVIQEQAPRILKYNDKTEEDAVLIGDKYSTFSAVVKDFVKDYSQTSDALKSQDFK